MATGERSHIYILNVGGSIELWFPEALRQSISKPISDVLP